MSNPWLRCLIRAAVIAVIFTPVMYSPLGRIGQLSMPAWYGLYVAFQEADRWLFFLITVQIAFATWIVWTIGLAVYWIRKTRKI